LHDHEFVRVLLLQQLSLFKTSGHGGAIFDFGLVIFDCGTRVKRPSSDSSEREMILLRPTVGNRLETDELRPISNQKSAIQNPKSKIKNHAWCRTLPATMNVWARPFTSQPAN